MKKVFYAALRGFFAVAGVGAIVFFVHDVGAEELLLRLKTAAPWIPVVLVLEIFRLISDAIASYYAYGEKARQIPKTVLLRAQLIGTAVGSITPAGRSSEEATKAALLTPWAGGPESISAAAVNQVATLIAGGLISIPCAVASGWMTGLSWVTLGLLVHALALVLLGLLIRWSTRSYRINTWMRGRFKRFSEEILAFREHSKGDSVFPVGPVVSLFSGRLAQVLQMGILGAAVGMKMSTIQAFFLEGLFLLSQAIGAFIPAQLGVSEGVFLFAADSLKGTEAQVLSVAVLLHVIQLFLVVLGTFVPLFWKTRIPSRPVRKSVPKQDES